MRGHRAVVGVVAILTLVATAPGTLAGGEEGCSTLTVDTIVHSSTTVCAGDGDPPSAPEPGQPDTVPELVDWARKAIPDVDPGPGPGTDELEETVQRETNATTGNCDGVWRFGVVVDQSENRTHVCVEVEYEYPGDGPIWGSVTTPGTEPCTDERSRGWTVREPETGSIVGICVIFEYAIPWNDHDDVEVDLEDCSFEGAPDGEDPRVQIGDGGVVVCATVFTDPGTAPEVDVEIEECPGGEDPALQVGGWRVAVCVDAGVRE